MITVGRLKELLEDLPEDALVWGYEGVDCGISIKNGKESNFIVAREWTEANDPQPYLEDGWQWY